MISYDYTIVSCTLPLQVQDTLFSVMVLLVTFVNYITTWQFLVNGHAAFFWQLHFGPWARVFDGCDFFNTSVDYFWQITQTMVANFNCTVVQKFVKFAAPWKMLFY